jgi:hypothetical protein
MDVTCSAVPCPVILSATCVFYQGANLVYTGINNNDNLEIALQKIDAKFQDAGLGYLFQNGIIQLGPGLPVGLGGSLTQNTLITGAYKLSLSGEIEASKLITTGGSSSQFVKGDGSLDSTAYQPTGNYISSLSGDGVASGPGAAVFTLANTGVIANTYGSATRVPIITVDAKGRVTNLTTTLIAVPSSLLLFGGDVTGSGNTGSSVVLTLQTVNSNIYPSNTFLKFAVNGKGLVTSAAPITNLDIEAVLGYIPVPNSRTITINGITQDLSVNRSWTIPVGTVTSVGLSMPTAFTVTNSPVTGAGTLTVTGAGTTDQYVRGDLSLGVFPSSPSGGGSSIGYYLNGSIAASVVGYEQLSRNPIFGLGTNYTTSTDGLIAQFLTDVGDPAFLSIPAGAWLVDLYFNADSAGGSPDFYVELYKYDGTTFTLLSTNVTTPEVITNGTAVDLYITSLSVPTTTLTLTDRLAIRVYVDCNGKTLTLHTENDNLSQVVTTFSTGIATLNGLVAQVQYFGVGTTGTDFNISSATNTHTFHLPTASATNRGALSSADWSTFNGKQNALTLTTTGSGAATLISDVLNIPTPPAPTFTSLTVTGDSGASTLLAGVLNVPTYTLSGLGGQPLATNLTSLSALTYASTSFVKMTAAGTFALDTSIYVPSTRTLTINGTTQDLSADRTFTVSTANIYNTDGTLTGNRTVTSGGYNLTLNPKTFYDNGLTFNASIGNVGTFINTQGYSTSSTQLYFYPDSGTNVAQTLNIIPRGTGFNPVFKAQFSVYNTDGIADSLNTEFVTFRAAGSLFTFASGKFGTGTIRPLMFSAGYATDSATNINQLYLSTAGNVLINSATDAGFKLDVNGTARITSQLTGATANFSGNAAFGTTQIGIGGTGGFGGGTSHWLEVVSASLTLNSSGSIEFRTGLFPTLAYTGAANALSQRSANINYTAGLTGYYNQYKSVLNATGNAFANTLYVRGFFVDSGTITPNSTTVIPIGFENVSGTNLFNSTSGSTLIGGQYSALSSSAKLQVDSITQGFLPPRMSTTDRGSIISPATGLQIYNTTTNTNQFWNGTVWGDIGGGGITSINTLTGSSQTIVAGTSGTDFAVSSTGTTHTLNLPNASAANRGALTSADWSAFNGKFTLPSLTSGSVLFSNGTTIAQDNSNFFWDDTNNRLGIGTSAPADPIHIIRQIGSQAIIRLQTLDNTNNDGYSGLNAYDNSGNLAFSFAYGNPGSFLPNTTIIGPRNATGTLSLVTTAAATTQMRMFANGNFLYQTGGTFTDTGQKLQVTGTARISSTTTLSSLSGTGSRMVVADATGVLSTNAIPSFTITASAIGTTPNAEGISILGASDLQLQPADENFGGIVSTANQNFSGNKTFFDTIRAGDAALLDYVEIEYTGITFRSGGGGGLATILATNISGSGPTASLELPTGSGTFALSVNSVSADTAGNITLTASSVGAEPALGNPSVSGYVLSSTTAGVRSWVAAGGGGSSTTFTTQSFTATAAQTTFTISGGYTPGLIQVNYNGSTLTVSEYTASNGTTVVLGFAAELNDILDFIIFTTTDVLTAKAFTTITYSGTPNWDYGTGYNKEITLTGNATLSITNDSDGDYGVLFVTQDAVGGRILTLPVGDNTTGLTAQTTANSIVIYSYAKRGSVRYWNASNR